MPRKILLLKDKNIQGKKFFSKNDSNISKNNYSELDPYEEEFFKRNNNYTCLFLPVLTHMLVGISDLSKILKYNNSLNNKFWGIIVTSKRAVEGLKVAWNEVFLKPESSSSSSLSTIRESWLKLPIFVVGKATEKSVENLGFNNVLGAKESGSSELLANYIETYYNEHKDQIIQKKTNVSTSTSIISTATPLLLFLVGDKRRDELPKKLLEVKINFQELLIYETKPNPQFSIELNKIIKTSSHHNGNDDDWWIVFFSPSGVDVAIEPLKKQFGGKDGNEELVWNSVDNNGNNSNSDNNNKIKIASIGKTTGRYLKDIKKIKVHVMSTEPDPENLLKSIDEYYNL